MSHPHHPTFTDKENPMSDYQSVDPQTAAVLAATVGWARNRRTEFEHEMDLEPDDRAPYVRGLRRRFTSDAAMWDELADLMEAVLLLRSGDSATALDALVPLVAGVADLIGIEEVPA
jgi:hypothetical protein